MNKKDYKDYQKPTMNVVHVQMQTHLLDVSNVDTNLDDDDTITIGGGSGGGIIIR